MLDQKSFSRAQNAISQMVTNRFSIRAVWSNLRIRNPRAAASAHQESTCCSFCASGIHVLQLLRIRNPRAAPSAHQESTCCSYYLWGCNLFKFTATQWRFMMQITCLFIRWKQLSDARATALDAIILSCGDPHTTRLTHWWAVRNTAGSKVHFFPLEDMIHSNWQ